MSHFIILSCKELALVEDLEISLYLLRTVASSGISDLPGNCPWVQGCSVFWKSLLWCLL